MLFPMVEPSLMLRHALMNLTTYQADADLTARAIPELIKLLTDEDQVVVSQATMMFYELSKEEASRHAIMNNTQLIAALGRVIRRTSTDLETTKGAVGILHNISYHYRGLAVISKSGVGIPALVNLLSSPVEAVHVSAIKTIHNLLRHYDKCKFHVHLAGGVQKMVPLLHLLRNNKTVLAIVTDCLKILGHGDQESKQMVFGDISVPAGLTKLNGHFKNFVFVQGYTARRVNAATFGALQAVPAVPKPNPHIQSNGDLRNTFPAATGTGNGKAASPADDDDDDMDRFSFNDGEEEAAGIQLRKKRWAENADKKSKPVPIAISSVILDVKPWCTETDMKEMEKKVRTVEMNGLLWGASKLVPVCHGMPKSLKKLKIICVMEDNTVSIEALQNEIQNLDYVQSVDVAAFNKL